MKRSERFPLFGAWFAPLGLAVTLPFASLLGQENAGSVERSPESSNLEAGAESRERRIQANARYAAAVSQHAKGQTEAATRELLIAADTDPSNFALQVKVAEKLLEWRLPTLALQVLDKASAQKDVPARLLVAKGNTHKLLGQEEPAQQAFRQALDISPGNVTARRELTTTQLKAKNVGAALALIREGVALPSLSGAQLAGLVGLYLQTIATDPKTMSELKTELTSLLERTSKSELTQPGEQVVLADGFTFIGEIDRAEDLLKGVLRAASNTALAREKLVDLYLRSGRTADAVSELNVLLEQDPKNASAHYLLGSIAADNQEYQTAISHYRKAIELRPEFEPPYYEMVGIHLNARQPRKALEVLSQARIRFPKRFLSEFYSGIALASLRRTKEALVHMLEAESIATKQSPQRLTPFFYFQLGSMLERNGKLEKAEGKFLKSLERNPEDAETLNYLGYMWAEKGKKLSQATVWIKKALELAPDSAAIQDSMGWVLFKQGDPERALPYLLNAEAGLEEPDPVILDHLGDAYHALGKHREALESWKSSLELEFNERIFEKIRRTEDSHPTSE